MKLDLLSARALVRVALLGCALGFGNRLPAVGPVEDYRFKIEVLATGMAQPLQLKLAPDGRIFFNELKGALKIWRPTTQTVVVAGVLPTFAEQENGFLDRKSTRLNSSHT